MTETVLRIEHGRAEPDEIAALTAALTVLRGGAGTSPAHRRRAARRPDRSRYVPPRSWTAGAGPDWTGPA